jgi:putative ABC transport system permease protein
VRATGDPAALAPAVTRAITATDAQVPVGRVRSMAGVLAASLAMQRFVMVLLAAFGGLAMTLAMVGIYGLVSWFVVRTTRDIGVRMALGALPRDVMLLVVRRGMALTLVGAAIGLLGAVALTRLLASLLFNVAAVDPLTLASTTVLLALCAAVASYLPARRASRVDPIVSLRAE